MAGNCKELENYLLENWNLLRAPFCPYFLRSFLRGSRVSIEAFFSNARNSELQQQQEFGDTVFDGVRLAGHAAAHDIGADIKFARTLR